jgi:hypothetical protein
MGLVIISFAMVVLKFASDMSETTPLRSTPKFCISSETPKKYKNMKKTSHIIHALVLTFLGLFTAAYAASGQVLVHDTFSDGVRTNQNLPDSLAWFSSSTAAALSAAPGSMTMSTTSSRQTVAYFTDGGPVSIGEGATLTLTYAFSLTGLTNASGNRFQVGLFNSGGSRIEADNGGSSNAVFNEYRGYKAQTSLMEGSDSPINIRARAVNSDTLMNATNPPYYNLHTSDTIVPDFEDNLAYLGFLSITNNGADGILVSTGFSGGNIAGIVSTSFTMTSANTQFTEFDTIAFFGVSGQLDSITFTDIHLELVPIPEPNSAWLQGMAVLLIVSSSFARRAKNGCKVVRKG